MCSHERCKVVMKDGAPACEQSRPEKYCWSTLQSQVAFASEKRKCFQIDYTICYYGKTNFCSYEKMVLSERHSIKMHRKASWKFYALTFIFRLISVLKFKKECATWRRLGEIHTVFVRCKCLITYAQYLCEQWTMSCNALCCAQETKSFIIVAMLWCLFFFNWSR